MAFTVLCLANFLFYCSLVITVWCNAVHSKLFVAIHMYYSDKEIFKVTIKSWNAVLNVAISLFSCKTVLPYPFLLINMISFCLFSFHFAQLYFSLSSRDSHNFVCHTEIRIFSSLFMNNTLGFSLWNRN